MRRAATAALAVLFVLLASPPPVGAAPQPFDHLAPGQRPDLPELVPVNIVFAGYEPDRVSDATFLAGLPQRYRPTIRSRLGYGIVEELGLDYSYDYDVTFTGRRWEDRFFAALSRLVRRQPLTELQQAYNDQDRNILDVMRNHHIDAPSVERWLAANPPPGVDTTENTLFFINWYGRPDFKFHVYTKTDEPDPDTGFSFGALDSRKVIAWGGTTPDDEESGLGSLHRIWFYDLSAGPESFTDNWNVDDLDLDGDGVTDYRMPPVWEYAPDGFRPPAALTRDLSLVARYVGINLLFTSSPIYPPSLTPPALPETVDLDTNTYEGWPGVDASQRYLTPALLLEELSELLPRHRLSYDQQDLSFTKRARRCYVTWRDSVLQGDQDTCHEDRPYPPYAALFVDNALKLDDLTDDDGRVDHEAGLFNYATTDALAAPFLGYADDNYQDGTQSLVFSFVSPTVASFGYGLTTTMIHEVGHHLSLSHPHDGFDYERRLNYQPTGPFYFAWSGTEHNSMMSYIDLNWDFSQFDRDNLSRFMTAAHVDNANRIAADILAAPTAPLAAAHLAAADVHVGRAKTYLAAHDYTGALAEAMAAYERVLAGADAADVEVLGDDSGTEVLPPLERSQLDRSAFVDSIAPGSHRARR